MYTRVKYSFRDMLWWTRLELCGFFLIALVPTFLFETLGMHWLRLPWTPIALIGTAVAFLIGFQNNAAYGRAWEARKIWGGVVNQSRTWAVMVRAMVTSEHAERPATEDELRLERTTLIHRHLAWITALRHAMRQKRPWEVFTQHRTNLEWYDKVCIPERDRALEDDLRPLLATDELQRVLQATNQAAAVLSLQSAHLLRLKQRGLVWEFSFLELEGLVRACPRIAGQIGADQELPLPAPVRHAQPRHGAGVHPAVAAGGRS